MTIHRVFLGVTFLATRAWLRPVSQGNRHFTVGGGRLRQSGPRPEARLLRQPALEGLTRSVRTDSPRQGARNKFRRERRRRPRRRKAVAAAAFERGEGGGHLELGLGFNVVCRSRTPQNPLPMLNTLSSVSMRESRVQYLCDPQWFRDTASRGPTTIVAPESQFQTCPTDHDSIGYPRMSASGESSTTMHRLLHASGSHPIPPPDDPNIIPVSSHVETLYELHHSAVRSSPDFVYKETIQQEMSKLEHRGDAQVGTSEDIQVGTVRGRPSWYNRGEEAQENNSSDRRPSADPVKAKSEQM
ncbi:Transcription factor jumonji domain-containing protein isoform 1 [Dorcoceras hygrometricum]|uniref:Transcription factor jumonji domain-containing protein isoform 1 n=1 Tax=Dorcoceras hygrometricum TaxID=472368 RepID=A0A2Z7DJQ4_9LAMI|nr:Transcription factor jumonji domain-containing protein isoform 1 [Dorcoceras hygrometricum]